MDLQAASGVCPLSDDSPNEDLLGAARHGELAHDDRVGRYRNIWAGRVTDENRLLESSSGGLTTYLLNRLISGRVVDAIIHVGRSESGHFEYKISRTTDEVDSRRKSDYTSVTFAEVLASVRGDGFKYAFVGIPCFVRAARALALVDPAVDVAIDLYIGLVCGHLKTQFFAESLAWQAGIRPHELNAIDFRVKVHGQESADYNYRATSQTGYEVERRVRDAIDGNWGFAAFQPEACNFCDDIFAEGADVVFADAWLPRYTDDWRGTNIVLTRDARVSELFEHGLRVGDIEIEPVALDEAVASQAGNYRHRRDGLRVRLADDLDAGLSVPRKRVEPARDHVGRRRLALIRSRRRMSADSLEWFCEAKDAGELRRYADRMEQAVVDYRRIESPRWRRPLVFGKLLARRLLSRLLRQGGGD